MIGSSVTGTRHSAGCRCGCQFVEGLTGRIVEEITVVAFEIPNPAAGKPREERVAYSTTAERGA